MLEVNRAPARQLVEIGIVHHSDESASDGEENLLSQLLDRWMISSEIEKMLNAIVAPLSTQLEMLIQSVTELSERSLTLSTEGNVTSDRSRSSGQRSDIDVAIVLHVVLPALQKSALCYISNFKCNEHECSEAEREQFG